MDYNTYTLPCGMRVIVRETRDPVIYCGYAVNAGTRDELPGEEGIAHLCEHMTFKGTSRRSPFQVINGLERVGGELNAFTTKERTVFYAAVLKKYFSRAVDLLTDIVFHSTYPEDEMKKETAVICDEIESYNDSPSDLIYDEFEDIIFRGHPLGHNILGTADKLKTYTRRDATRFARRTYAPENTVFFVCGLVSTTHVITLLSRATSTFSDSAPCVLRCAESKPLPPYTPQEIVRRRSTHQAHVMMGVRACGMRDVRRTALTLITNILGGTGMNARLNLSLREKRGLVYTVECVMTTYSDAGLWAVYFACDPADTDRCRKLATKEIARLRAQPLTAARLASAKRQMRGQVSIACDNRESFTLSFGKSFLHTGEGKDIDRLLADIDALTPSQIQDAAEMLDPQKITTLIYI